MLGLAGLVAGPAVADEGAAVVAPGEISAVSASERTEPTTADPGSLVIVGTGGLSWADVDPSTTPTLWSLVGSGSVGSVSVRTSSPQTCALDAWLTVSAGRRTGAVAADETQEQEQSDERDEAAPALCPDLPTVQPTESGGAVVPGWVQVVTPTEEGPADPRPGALAASVAATGWCTTAVGPGAALALADGNGSVARYVPTLGDFDAQVVAACPVTVVDAGQIEDDATGRTAALTRFDSTLSALLAQVPDDTRVLVAGLADPATDQLGLQVVVERSRGQAAGWLTSSSTRRAGLVTLADLSATVAETVGGSSEEFDGAAVTVGGERRMSTARTVENRRYLTQMTTTVRHVMPLFVGVLGLAVIAALAASAWAGRRAAARGVAVPPAVVRATTAVLLLASLAPAGAYLAALTRWWSSAVPPVAAVVAGLAGSLLLALLAWWGARVTARHGGSWTLAAWAAGLSWVLLTVDGMTGTVLQQGSLLGSMPALGARYYGFGNYAFAVYAAAALVLAGALAAVPWRAGRTGRAVGVVLTIGTVTVVVDGGPTFGADFGGILALVPAFALLALSVARVRLTLRRVLVVVAATAGTVLLVAVVDWALADQGSHVGTFVRRVLAGQAAGTITGKAAGAWATIAHPLGAVALLLCLAAGVLLVGPRRWRPPALLRAEQTWPLLAPVLSAVVLAAALGTLLNDSGIVVGAILLSMAGGFLGCSAVSRPVLERGPRAAGAAPAWADSPVRRLPATLAATAGGLLSVVLLATFMVPSGQAAAGDVSHSEGTAPLIDGTRPVVLIGVQGLRWQDVTRTGTPTLWGLLSDGAAATGVTAGVAGTNGRCESAGWLSLSTGLAPVTGSTVDGEWVCDGWSVTAEGEGAAVQGWSQLVARQSGSSYHPALGVLGQALADKGVCATAVGPGAALALADDDGRVARYRELATVGTDDLTACPVTVVDAGGAAYDASADSAAQAERVTGLTALDAQVRRLVRAAGSQALVLVVGVGNPAAGRPWLGVGVVADGDPTPRFWTAPSTRWEGVVRLLDLPTSLTSAYAGAVPSQFTGSPVTTGAARPRDTTTSVDQLAVLSVRDHQLRRVGGLTTTTPMLVGLVFVVLLASGPSLGRRWRRGAGPEGADRASPGTDRSGRQRWGSPARVGVRVLDAVFVVLSALPVGLFLMSSWQWWRFSRPGVALVVAVVASTLFVSGAVALVPRRPLWLGPAVVSAVTFVVLTLDAVLGTPLHRGSPLGPAPTLGGRYYGFGNPTYSVYVVAALVTAAAVATLLVRCGRRRAAVLVTVLIGLVTLAVDVMPMLGADLGGGLVLVPAFGILALAVAGRAITWSRLVVIGVIGVAAVGLVAVLDWLRPVADRSHLGQFVQSVVDGTWWGTVARKAGYAAATVTSGPMAWLTLVVLLALLVLWWRALRGRSARFGALEQQWPLLRALLLSLLVAAVAGGLVNDYGVRIATVMLFAGVPLAGMLLTRGEALPGPDQTDGR